MSRLTVFTEAAAPVLSTEDPTRIAATLGGIGVRFERWAAPPPPPRDATAAVILAAYRPHLDRLMGESGAGSADVVTLDADTPDLGALRRKFLAEHTHTEDEVRFFVHGQGSFILHVGSQVYDALCGPGDLIAVPSGVAHWFDAGERPDLVVLRVFTESSGWIAHYTGDPISERFAAA